MRGCIYGRLDARGCAAAVAAAVGRGPVSVSPLLWLKLRVAFERSLMCVDRAAGALQGFGRFQTAETESPQTKETVSFLNCDDDEKPQPGPAIGDAAAAAAAAAACCWDRSSRVQCLDFIIRVRSTFRALLLICICCCCCCCLLLLLLAAGTEAAECNA